MTKIKQERKFVIVTIDGPAGAGKSSVAKALAKRLKFSYLDTGAMYRALTLKAVREKINLKDEGALVRLAKKTKIDLKDDSQKGLVILLDGKDVSEEIRSEQVTNNTFYIARTPGVRGVMVEWQRRIGQQRSVVVEGRDIGTVVFPHATYKFYLDADFEERAKRRINELKAKGAQINDTAVKIDLKERDTKDSTRKVGPLKKADDAILIDSTNFSVDEVVEKILGHIKQFSTVNHSS